MKTRIAIFLAALLLTPFALLALSGQASAQLTGPVYTYGPVTPGHCMEWYAYGWAEDSGAGCGGGGGGSGTVTSFSFTNGSGFTGTVSTPTTTPALALTINSALPLFGYATSGLPTCNATTNVGAIAYTTDGTPALTFCAGAAGWVNSGGTQFTYVATGCTPSASAGSATAGTITLAAGPCTSIVITFNGAVGMSAPNGWHCNVSDRALNGPTSWFGEWGESTSTTTTATIQIPGAAGATDTISFNCSPF